MSRISGLLTVLLTVLLLGMSTAPVPTGRAASSSTTSPETAIAAAPAPAPAPAPAAVNATANAADELAALLPASDVIIAADVPRAMRELLPRLKGLGIADIDQIAAEVENFARLAGVDPQKLGTAVAGVRLSGLKIAGGALVIGGIDLDAKRVETAATAAKWEFQTIDAEGKKLYRLARLRPAQAPPAGTAAPAEPPPPPKTDEIYFALPGNARLIVGDQGSVRAALAAVPSASTNAAQLGALKEARSTAIARFAAQLPADLKAMLESQGDLFKQLAAVKVIFGSLDLAPSGDATIEARLRNASAPEAAEMETGLKSLVFLAKSFLGSTQDPKMQAIQQLIDQIKVVTTGSDVELSVAIPKVLLDQWSK